MPAPTADDTAFAPSLSFHAPGTADLVGAALPAIGRRWAGIGSSLVSIAILAVAIYQLRATAISHVMALVPRSASFWLVFALAYLATPISEWVIYRRLWSIPPSGLLALLRKRVANEIVLGYLGEVYFYAWVRRTGLITRSAPFGAIKDVAILSALTGNVITLAMLAAALPSFGLLRLDFGGKAIVGSLGVLAVTSFAMVLLRRRLFTLPGDELWRITVVHFARIAATIGLTGLLWHLSLPTVALIWWLLLATLRQLLSRLPLVPNKDLAFVGLAVFVVGRDGDIAAMIAMIGGLVLLTHLLAGSALGAFGLVRRSAAA